MRYGWLLSVVLLAACKDSDGDGTRDQKDCLPDDPGANPEAAEVCDGVDNDCDGLVDEDVAIVAYLDRDRDGFGEEASKRRVCELPENGSEVAGDCDDEDPRINPDEVEVCNDVDDDCDGAVDQGVTTTFYGDGDGDGHGVAGDTLDACFTPDGYASAPDDCDDADPRAWDGAEEVCDGSDNDCDGATDEDLPLGPAWEDADGDGYGDPSRPTIACGPTDTVADNALDCDDGDPGRSPDTIETRGDGVDDDCDGFVDEYGIGPDNEFETVDDALDEAPDGAVLQLDDGVYVGTIDLTGRSVTLAGEGCDRTTVYADGQGTGIRLDAGLVVGLRVTGGTGTDRGDGFTVGGGVLAEGTAKLLRVCVDDNQAFFGGGIAVTGGVVQLDDVRVAHNRSTDLGGGVWAATTADRVDLTRSRVLANRSGSRGGGLAVDGTDALVTNTVFAANSCYNRGCAAYVDEEPDGSGGWTPGSAVIDQSTFHANTSDPAATDAFGEAIVARGSDVSLHNSLFTGHLRPSDVLEESKGDSPITGDITTSFVGLRGNTGTDVDLGLFLLDRLDGAAAYVQVDPTLDPTEWDLRLRAGSEVVDQGDPARQDRDGGRSDLGAYGGASAVDGWDYGFTADEDADGLLTGDELWAGGDPWTDDALVDADGDGATLAEELENGTDPWDVDSDADGVEDGVELGLGTDPVSAWDHAPGADAGRDRYAMVGGGVPLDARGSFDPDGDPLTYTWSVVSRPAGSVASVGAGATTTLDPDVAGTYVVELTVDDGGTSRTDRVEIRAWEGLTVPDDAPTLAAALAAAGEGEAIGLRAGTWIANLDTSGRDIALIGLAAADEVVLEGAGGGSVVSATGGHLALGHLTVQGGVAVQGGGLSLASLTGVELLDVTFRHNRAGNGGAAAFTESPLLARDVRVLDNRADEEGGGFLVFGATITVEDTLFAGNEASSGGALRLVSLASDAQADARLTRTTFSDNRADDGAAFTTSGISVDVRGDHLAFVGNRGGSLAYGGPDNRVVLLGQVVDENRTSLLFDGQAATNAVVYQPFGGVWDEVPTQPFFVGAGDVATSGLWLEADPALASIADDGDRTDDVLGSRGTSARDRGFIEHVDRDGTRADAGPCAGPDAPAACGWYRLDGDGDGLPDGWEAAFGLSVSTDDASADPDADGLTNTQELQLGTRPDRTDTDSDGVRDGLEAAAGDDPRSDLDHRARAVTDEVVLTSLGAPAVLDGTASFDPDGGDVTWQWRVLSRPVGSTATLVGATQATAALTPDVEGAYRLALVVDDGDAPSRETVVWILIPDVITVPGDYPTVALAYEAAEPNDTIFVGPGTWPTRVNTGDKPVTIVGAGVGATLLVGEDSQNIFQVGTTAGLPERLALRDLTLTGAANQLGGALRCDGGILDLERVSIQDNTATQGGGVYMVAGCDLTLRDTDLLRNHAADSGGGIYALDSSLVWEGGRAEQNEVAFDGGALLMLNSTTEVRNVAFVRNSSDEDGPAMLYQFYGAAPAGSMWLENVSVVGNDGTRGAVTRGDGTPTTIRDSLFVDNENYGFYDIFLPNTDLVVENVGWAGNKTDYFPSDLVQTGAVEVLDGRLVSYDPDLASTAVDPGEDDVRLLSQSPFRDAGLGTDRDGSTGDLGAFGGPGAPDGWDAAFLDGEGDGLPDAWEVAVGLNPAIDDANGDPDGDGVTNLNEHRNVGDPFETDSDHDGEEDGAEALAGTDPADWRDNAPEPRPGGNNNQGQVGVPLVRTATVGFGDPIVAWAWTLTSKPGRSALTTASLQGRNTATVTITPDVPGMYVVSLAVSDDGVGWSDPESFELRVVGTVAVPQDYATIGEAVYASWDDGVITIAAGVYHERLDLSGRDLTLDGAGRDLTILDADRLARVVEANNNETLVLRDLTLRNGLSGRGGDLYRVGGTATLDQVTIELGRAAEGGGVFQQGGTLNATGLRLVDDFAGFRGGGIATTGNANLTLDQSLVAADRVADNQGGGLRLIDTNATLTNVVFHDNAGYTGGAIYATSADVVVDQCTFTHNFASMDGAVMYADFDGVYAVTNSIVVDNAGTYPLQDRYDAANNRWGTYVQDFTMLEGNALDVALTGPDSVVPVDGQDGNLVDNGYDPRFRDVSDDGDWSNDNWTLLAGSDAINAGDPASPQDPNGTRADMGAHGGPGGSFTP